MITQKNKNFYIQNAQNNLNRKYRGGKGYDSKQKNLSNGKKIK